MFHVSFLVRVLFCASVWIPFHRFLEDIQRTRSGVIKWVQLVVKRQAIDIDAFVQAQLCELQLLLDCWWFRAWAIDLALDVTICQTVEWQEPIVLIKRLAIS